MSYNIERAKEMLRLAAEYIERYPDFTIEYDETTCDGYCLAEDCRTAASMLETDE